MEVKEKSKKRELIKTIAIVFLVILLILTFFSGTIMNYSLPEVATQMVSSGTINAKIRGSGTLAANETYEVNLNQTRGVRSVCVKTGDTVAEGDLLFVLEDVESDELQTAQEELSNLQIEYQKQVLNLSKGYAENDQTVKTIREDLEKAIAQRDANFVTDEQVSYAKGDLASAKSDLSQTDLIIKDLNDLQSENEDYTKAQAKVTEAQAKVAEAEGKITSLTSEAEGYEEQLSKLETGDGISESRKIQDARDALDKAQTKWKGDWLAYEQTIRDLMEQVPGYSFASLRSNGDGTYSFDTSVQIAIDGYLREKELEISTKPSLPDSGGEEDEQTMAGEEDAYDSRWRSTYNALLADQLDVDQKTQELQRAQQDSSITSGNAASERRAIQDKLYNAQSKLSTAQQELRAAQQDLQAAQQELETASGANAQLKEQVRAHEAIKRQQEANITTLEESLAALQEKQTAYKAAVETVEAKQRELETSLTGKDIDKQLNNLDLQAMSLKIEKQKELVEKYRKDSTEAEIKAPVPGVISAINVSAGKETTPDKPLATIDVVDRGYIIKIPVTNEQAKQVRVGDAAEVTNFYWGGEISAVLESIAPDPSSSGQKKLLVFRVSGDIEAGTNISLSVGQRSAPMDTIVPKSAIREDANGKFVLIVTSKSTPLGNRYTATRADVQVIAEDDTSAAISGVAANDYVITTSSKPLDAGSQVRMVENPS